MFCFRSKRSSLVKRLWRHTVRPSSQPTPSTSDERELRALVSALLKRLKEPLLEGLLRAVEQKGAESGPCCKVPSQELRLGRRGLISPHLLIVQLWRWGDIQEEEELVQVASLCQPLSHEEEGIYVCCNPYHWARRLPTPGLQSSDFGQALPLHVSLPPSTTSLPPSPFSQLSPSPSPPSSSSSPP